MLKPICVPCQRFFRPKRNGFAFIEGMPTINTPEDISGRRQPKLWQPYKAWVGDMWECPDCKAQVIVGVAHQPVSEHYKPDFQQEVDRLGASQLQVNDC